MQNNVLLCVDSNETTRSDVEKENNWISFSGLTLGDSYWFQVTALDAEGDESPSKPKIFVLKVRTGM